VCVYIYAYTYTQDEFVSSVTLEKEAEVQAKRAEQDKLKLRHTFSKAIRIVALYSRLLGHCLLRTLLQRCCSFCLDDLQAFVLLVCC